MKKRLKALFKSIPGLAIKIPEIAKRLEVYEEFQIEAMKAALFDLVEEGFLARVGKRYKLNSGGLIKKLIGTLSITEGGYGFVVLEDKSMQDVFIPSRYIGTAFNGDTVEVSLLAKKRGKNIEGQIVDIVKRNKEEVVGILEKNKSFYFVVPDDVKFHRDIYIPKGKLNGAKPGEKVVVSNITWETPELNPEGVVKEILGKAGAYDTEIASLAREFNLPYSFPDHVISEADRIPSEIPAEEIENRLDLRSKNIVTIDPEDAKDFDDAVSIESLENGNYSVGIHIADVSHYVKQNSPLDKEALRRGNSVYFVGKVIPMLPENLSNGICSLKPFEDRLAFSVIAEMTESGKVVSYEIAKTIINSKRRFTYEEAQEVLDTGKGDFANELLMLNKIARNLRETRMKSGSINFISPEIKFRLDEEGIPVEITKKELKESNNLIEEYMLLANQVVSKHVGGVRRKVKPNFVYRVHDLPDQEKIVEFANFVKTLGYSFNPNAANKTKEFQKLLNNIKGKAEEDLVNEVAIRSMAKAVYSVQNIGHYGLGFKYYSHFTSPIRRYPDLVAHRLLFHYLQTGTDDIYGYNELEEICDHASATERNAVNAERASVKIKQMEYLEKHVGEDFRGVISGVTNFGIFVELIDSLAEGLIRLRDLNDDFYVFDEKSYSLNGRRTQNRYRLGDKVTVRLIRVDIEKREMDFLLLDENN